MDSEWIWIGRAFRWWASPGRFFPNHLCRQTYRCPVFLMMLMMSRTIWTLCRRRSPMSIPFPLVWPLRDWPEFGVVSSVFPTDAHEHFLSLDRSNKLNTDTVWPDLPEHKHHETTNLNLKLSRHTNTVNFVDYYVTWEAVVNWRSFKLIVTPSVDEFITTHAKIMVFACANMFSADNGEHIQLCS